MHFKDLYVNRMRFEGNKKPVKSVQVEIEAPKLSTKTEKMAQQHRAKIAGHNANVDIVEFLLTKNEVKNKIKEVKAQSVKSAKQLEDDEELTLKPKTNNFVHKLDQYKQTSGDRGFDLYSKVKKAQFTVKHDKTLAEYELEKGYKECTHNPVINQFSDDNLPVWRLPADQEIKGLDKFVQRAH